MARGNRPDCHCFGQLHSEPIGLSTLLRNGFLAVVAAAVLWLVPHQPALSLSAAVSMILAGHPLISVLVGGFVLALAAQAYLTFHLFRQNGRLLLRVEALESAPGGVAQSAAAPYSGLAKGSPAPKFELPWHEVGPVRSIACSKWVRRFSWYSRMRLAGLARRSCPSWSAGKVDTQKN